MAPSYGNFAARFSVLRVGRNRVTRLILALAVVFAVQSASAQEIEPRPAPGPEAGAGGGAAWERAAERARRDGAGVHLRVLEDYDLPSGVTASEPIVVIGG